MPITNRSEAKEGGFAQVRDALVAFEGDVVEVDARGNKTEFGKWGTATNDDGSTRAPKEYLQISCVNVVPTEVTEDLSMDITEGWTFRINCSDFKGSFWIDVFLESADKFKIQIPEGLIGKRIGFRKVTLEAKGKDGQPNPKFNSTNYIIEKVLGGKVTPPNPVVKPASIIKPASPIQSSAPVVTTPQVEEVVAEETPTTADPMVAALELAVGKTEQQFRSAIILHPLYINSPMLPLAKSGAVTQTLVNTGKLKLVAVNGKQVYQKV